MQEHLSKAYNGLSSSFNLIQDWVQDEDTVVFLKLFTILYADDTVVFAESRAELQAAMHGMLHYCIMWKLDINVHKTKVVIYGSKPRGRLHKTFLPLDAGASESQGGRSRKFGCIKRLQVLRHKIDVANVCDVVLSFTFSLETRLIFYKSHIFDHI